MISTPLPPSIIPKYTFLSISYFSPYNPLNTKNLYIHNYEPIRYNIKNLSITISSIKNNSLSSPTSSTLQYNIKPKKTLPHLSTNQNYINHVLIFLQLHINKKTSFYNKY